MGALTRLFARRAPAEGTPVTAVLPRLNEMAREVGRRNYRQGLVDGMGEVLDQLEGRSKLAQGEAPPLSDETRFWIAGVRARMDQLRAEDRLR